jgi:hypothetical protein
METTLLKKNNSIQGSEGKEENGYPFPDPTKQCKMTLRNPEMPSKTPSKKKS